MHLDERARDAQAEPQSRRREFLAAAALHEQVEDAFQHVGANADAFVGDRDQHLAVERLGLELDLGTERAVDRCVVQQVGEDLAQPGLVAVDHHRPGLEIRRQRLALAIQQRARHFHGLRDHRGHVQRGAQETHLAGGDPRDIEQIGDEPVEVPGLAIDDVDLQRRTAWCLSTQQFRGSQDRRQRIAQLVPEHREKGVVRFRGGVGTIGSIALRQRRQLAHLMPMGVGELLLCQARQHGAQAGADVMDQPQVAIGVGRGPAFDAERAELLPWLAQRIGDGVHRQPLAGRCARGERRLDQRASRGRRGCGSQGRALAVARLHHPPRQPVAAAHRQRAALEFDDPVQPGADRARDGGRVRQARAFRHQLQHEVETADLAEVIHGVRIDRTWRRPPCPSRPRGCWRRPRARPSR